MREFIPVCEPLLDGNELKYVSDCITTNWISSEGSYVSLFETNVAKLCNRKHAVSVSNGTAALDLVFYSLNLQPGDEVIVPDFTIISCINQLLRMKVKPVFVDIDKETLNIDVAQIQNKINQNTKAILMVHIYGLTCDVDAISAICANHDLILIEDAAEAIGQTYKGKPCGGFGYVSTFSFYSNKFVTTGEGGMILTNSDELNDRLRSLRNLAFDAERRFYHQEIGWNMRMTNLQAAIGVAQLERLQQTLQRKRDIAKIYQSKLSDITALKLPLNTTSHCDNCFWVYPIMIADENHTLEDFLLYLKHNSIGTRPFFHPLHSQPVIEKYYEYDDRDFPNANLAYKTGVYIPNGLTLKNEDIEYVSEKIEQYFA